jgi:membrane protease YdiL (CAAX protease family)
MLSAVSYTMAGLLITLITYLFLQQLGITPVQPATLNPENAGELALAALCAAVIPALCEELLFRGLVQGVIARRWGDRPAVWLTSLLFALMHFTLLGFPVLLVIGLLLSRLMLTGKTLLLTMIFHAMYNFSVLTINYSGAVPGFGVMLLCAAVFWLTSRFLFKEVPNEI